MIKINKRNPNDKKMQKLLDIIYDEPEFYPGSFHPNTNISEIIDSIYKLLFEEDNKSLHIIIDKNSNESLNLTIDKIS